MRFCAICDLPIYKGEPRKQVAGQLIHRYCDIQFAVKPCADVKCEFWQLEHGGPCE